MESRIDLSLAGQTVKNPHLFHTPSMRQVVYLDRMLSFLSEHVRWHGLCLSSREWGELMVAAWRKEVPVPGLTGSVAFIGGNYRSLNDEQCSEVITIAEEVLCRLGLSLQAPPVQPLLLHQTGDGLADLSLVDLAMERQRIPPAESRRRCSTPWGSVERRARLPKIFEPDDLSPKGLPHTDGDNHVE